MDPICRLRLHSWIPPHVVMNHSIRSDEIEARPPCLERDEKDWNFGLIIELFHNFKPIFCGTVEVAETNAPLFKIVAHNLKHSSILTKDDRLMIAFHEVL